MDKRTIGFGLMGAVLIKAIATLLLGFTFAPLQVGIASLIFLCGLGLALSSRFS